MNSEAGDGARTHDPQLGKLMLYQLSYAREFGIVAVLRGTAPPGLFLAGVAFGPLSPHSLWVVLRSGTQRGFPEMTRILAVCVLVAALVAPAALAADPVPADFKNAAKYCKAVRESKGVDAFQTQFGTNKNKKNAFGKCVASTAKAKAAKREDTAETNTATADCKKQQTADAAKFAHDYKNFGQCVKSHKGDDDSD